MNEVITGLMVVLSQASVVLVLIAVVVVFLAIRRKQKDNSLCKKFIEILKHREGPRKDTLVEALQKVHQMDDEQAAQTAKSMLDSEKKIYNQVLKLFMGHDRAALGEIQKNVESMANGYRTLIVTAEGVEQGGNPELVTELRASKKKIIAERDKIQEDLNEAMGSMENMLKEYTLMYSGGGAKKEGLKHIENELGQLKQKIGENLVEEVDDNEEDDSEEDVPDITPPESPEQNKE